MDKVTAAMVLTSLSTSPLVRSPPVKVSECLNGSWKDGGFTPSSYSSSGYWSWSAPSDQSNPSTPSPPLSADSFKPFRMPSLNGPTDDNIDEHDGNSLLFDEPIPRKRKEKWMKEDNGFTVQDTQNPHPPAAKILGTVCGSHGTEPIDEWSPWDLAYLEVSLLNMMVLCRGNLAVLTKISYQGLSKAPIYFIIQFIRTVSGAPYILPNSMKVMFKCLWKNCGKVLSSAAGIQRHIRTVHLGRNCDSECSDGEEDFYYTEIKLNTDSVADGLSSLSPVSPSVLPPPPVLDQRQPESTNGTKSENSSTTPLSRSAPSALYLVHSDHAYQATAPVTIPSTSSNGFTPSSSSFSISWQSPPVTFTGNSASPTHSRTQSFGEQRSQTIAVLSSPPRAAGSLSRKSRGEGKKCRKVYGMENRDMWCTACRWKKACQRFVD
ncbi:hypothetical protein DNTS_025469 [Danionella cerebrum]|uniref:C2H2-type domain-containing protein n=1 Tax=Danionella cerebrum TaxID=2873325 RepID=A0A553Q377_9TELE|nr:hypothetical protein DNTS_025469 [Danionella translucida]